MDMKVFEKKILDMYETLKKSHTSDFDSLNIKKAWKTELENIDDSVIMHVDGIPAIYKIYLLNIKYGIENILNETQFKKGKCRLNNLVLFNVNTANRFRIEILNVNKGKLYLEGSHQFYWLLEQYELICIAAKKKRVEIKEFDIPYKDKKAFGNTFFKGKGFKVEIPLAKNKDIRFYLQNKETKKKHLLKFTLGKFAKMTAELEHSYCKAGRYLIYQQNEDTITWKSARKKDWLKQELELHKEMKNMGASTETLILRWLYWFNRAFSKRKWWLVSDRSNQASDNGKCFFEYLQTTEKKKDTYFVIDKKSSDYYMMKAIGKVLPHGTFRYKLKYLLAEKIISSHNTEYILNPFGSDKIYFQDIFNYDFVFLQHGIIKDNYSGFLHKHKKNIRYFITSSEEEYKSILDNGYGYTSREVILTGLARYDNLKNNNKNKIIIMPTWRKWLIGKVVEGTSEYLYDENFKKSEYYNFYQKLINDERIINKLKEYNMTGEFIIHPILKKQSIDFNDNDIIKIVDENVNYSKVFAEGNILVTDYSSVSFDFAYLKKAIIYAMFDYDEFYSNHTISDRGYFNYHTDGFGEVAYDYENTVIAILSAIENKGKMEDKYIKRVDEFFAFNDSNNCERIYNNLV